MMGNGVFIELFRIQLQILIDDQLLILLHLMQKKQLMKVVP